jgi:[acyl-carrier-protein] S-malonyltransferase
VLVVVAPGQGSQTPGFLAPWLELPDTAERLEWFSAVAGIDLIAHGTTSDQATIQDTAVAQPLIVAAGLVSLLQLFPHPSDAHAAVGVGAGHSVGEITAAAAVGVITAESAMVLVRERGRAMAAASAAVPTGMSAVLGGDPDEVLAAVERHHLVPANVNGAGQVVAAGLLDDLAALKADAPAKTRVMPLKVAGAFHTHHMAPAVELLQRHSRAITTHDARLPLVSNADGRVVHDGREVLRRIVGQVSNPVRWDLCMETFADLGVTALLEITPAGTLAGLAKRALPGVEIVALKTPDDLDAARDLVRRHSGRTRQSQMTGSPSWRLLVSPSKGMVRRTLLLPDSADGSGDGSGDGAGIELVAGTEVAVVEGRREQAVVRAGHDGTVVEWLVEEGDPVVPGQPLLRMLPAGQA